MSYRECCKGSTTWIIEEEIWSVYGYGLNNGGEYLGAKNKPNGPPVGCPAGYDWFYNNPKADRAFYERKERLYNRTVRREVIEGPDGCEDGCLDTSGGKLIKKVLISEDNVDYGLENRIQKVPSSYSTETHWVYNHPYCAGEANGWEEFKYKKEVYKKIYHKTYKSTHQCAECCPDNREVPDTFNKLTEYEKWVKNL